jgi:hypothetical protein
MIDERPCVQRVAVVESRMARTTVRHSAGRGLGHPPLWIGGVLAIALLSGGCSSSGASKRTALLGIPLPTLSGQSSSEEAAFRKKVEKDPFPPAGASLAKSGQLTGLR